MGLKQNEYLRASDDWFEPLSTGKRRDRKEDESRNEFTEGRVGDTRTRTARELDVWFDEGLSSGKGLRKK